MSQLQKLFVLDTGGTIGMQHTATGLAPAQGGLQAHFAALLATLPAAQQISQWHWQTQQPLIDSANMTPANWLAMRAAIIDAVTARGCDSVLILHGTDTLAWSAAALACLLHQLPVPVVLTGAMQPFDQSGSDATDNLRGALQALAQAPAASVGLYFHGQLFNACQVRKHSAHAHNAFRALPHGHPQPTAQLPDYRQAIRPARLALLTLFPGFQSAVLHAALEHCDAIVLECYGCGTAPHADEFLAALQSARQRGIAIAAISQCEHAQLDFNAYSAGASLHNAGVLDGSAMHRELALARLFTLVGAGYGHEHIAQHFPLPALTRAGSATAIA